KAVGIGAGDEVILPSHTYIASAASVHLVGATPVLAECGADHMLDAADVEKRITPQTKAIMPVQINGRPCDMDALRAIAEKHGVAASIVFRLASIALVISANASTEVTGALAMLALALSLATLEKPRAKALETLGLKKISVTEVKAGLVLFFKLLAVLIALGIAARAVGMDDTQAVADVLRKQETAGIFAIIALAPIAEELLFRGYLQRKFGIILPSIAFALLHAPYGSIVEVAGALAAGLLFARETKLRGTVVPAIVAHFLLNAWALVTVLVLKATG
ncbi:MAG: DegT/DnrJ/EryC1/StrS family aminotransferase, partial [Candidatus Micrarchaeota archaeon]